MLTALLHLKQLLQALPPLVDAISGTTTATLLTAARCAWEDPACVQLLHSIIATVDKVCARSVAL